MECEDEAMAVIGKKRGLCLLAVLNRKGWVAEEGKEEDLKTPRPRKGGR